MRYIKLQHELIHARYDEPTGKWHLKLRRPVAGSSPDDPQFEVIEDTADIVHAGVGALSRWAWPDIEGLDSFKGIIRHSAGWEVDDDEAWQDEAKTWREKNVGVIGVVSRSQVPDHSEAYDASLGILCPPNRPSSSAVCETLLQLRAWKNLAFSAFCVGKDWRAFEEWLRFREL